MPNVFGIADDILVAGYEADGRDHEEQYRGYYRDAGRST